jgi:formylglycine-generating enzyme required for sulfatase activity
MDNLLHEDWNDGFGTHAPVGRFEPNPFGLHDVCGNVWEWCREPVSFPATLRAGEGERVPAEGVPIGNGWIVRGGCYSSTAEETRSASRMDVAPELAIAIVGLRPMRRLERNP